MIILKRVPLILSLFLFCLSLCHIASAQDERQKQMEKLSYMIGDWVGTSKLMENGEVVQQVPAFEKISYDLNRHIIVIQLRSELLQLHTIIHYSEKDGKYYYYAFSEKGGGQLPAEFKNGQLVVTKNESTRYIFRKTESGGFQEYGEKKVDGKWVRYFEDTFTNTQE